MICWVICLDSIHSAAKIQNNPIWHGVVLGDPPAELHG